MNASCSIGVFVVLLLRWIPTLAQCESEVKKADDQVWADHRQAMLLSQEAVKTFAGKGSLCEGKTLFVLGKTLWSNGDYAQSIAVLRRAIIHAQRADDTETVARSQLVMANNFYYQAYYDSAEKYFEGCRQSFQRINHRTGLIEVLHDMALMYHRKGDFSTSLKCLLESEQRKEMEPDFVHYVGDFTGISTSFIDSTYYRQEIIDEMASLKNFDLSGNLEGVYQSFINLGIAYRELNEHRISARYFVKGSQLMSSLGFYPFWDLAGVAYGKVGMEDSCFYFHYKAKTEFPRATKIKILYTYELLGNAHLQFAHLDSALWYYEKSLAMNEAMNNRLTIAGLQLSLARVYQAKKMNDKTKQYLDQALSKSKGISVTLTSKSYHFATQFYRESNPALALQFSERYRNLTDSINRNENAMAMIRFQTQFETARKERDLDAARLQLRNRTMMMLSFAVITVLSLAFVITLYFQRRKIQRQNATLNESNAEQKALMQEIHHRIKNNLQYVVSLLSLQTQHVRNPEVMTQIEEVKTRIMTIGLIHQNLYQSRSIQYVDLPQFVGDLISNIIRVFPTRVQLKESVHVDLLSVDLETAISVGLLINELTTNALKHALMDHPQPEYKLYVSRVGETLSITINDNGPGFSLDESTKGFGMRLVSLLLRKLEGTMAQSDPRTINIKIKNFVVRSN